MNKFKKGYFECPSKYTKYTRKSFREISTASKITMQNNTVT